ncbi:MAG: UDP-N-acetylglucosamine 2-epimerase (non-hydrolyzing) [Bacilli bacterium]|nr:UDP-N-acetylglucosamine 2-epimerase (non-hydrolyzing) [Bacilli bacterium]MDD3304946.1 UDP-N-acetylglucosamine 2-epimerase (non-hydrolyzing) [Bacilli bacterium]MDD4054058.1 UDP-N-acetylglucosamine 2-epimerase (non-hydrolyzing) [Bacilli bacterium]MDD4411421.1 UDP-N-acetylglucosamine 2-epimerase (non-hydrolyzing) [Bacilli bacterium]
MLKVMIVVGTRPEIIRLSEVIKNCEKYFKTVLVHTGQNYDYNLNEVFFKDFNLKKPDYYLDAPGKHLGETVGNIISRSYEIIQKEMPDALLVLGDTNSCLAAYSAKRLKVPIFHMEAGNRCFDFNVPEEINRRVVDHISDVNLAYTENARRYLINEGIKNDFLYVTGSPMAEVLYKNMEDINNSDVLKQLDLEPNGYFVVSAHREENIDIEKNFIQLVESLNEVAKKYNKPIIFSTHPRTKKRIEEKGIIFDKLIRNIEPLGFFDYVRLQKDAYCVLSDSGTIPEESAILNFPGVSIRTSTERPEALDAGSVVLGGIDKENMINAIEIAVKSYVENKGNPVKDYRDINVSEKVVKIIQSYTNIVNIRTWRK